MAIAAQEMESKKPACPECGTEVQSTWRWCLACGFDPDGLHEVHEPRVPTDAPAEPAEATAASRTGTSWTVVIVIVGLLLAGSLFYARTKNSTAADTSDPAAVEVTTTVITWTLYQSAEGAFSLFVPTSPTAETYDVPLGATPRTLHNFTSVFGDDSYTVSYLDGDAAEAALPPAQRLHTFATNYAAIIGATPTQTTAVTVDGNPALDFSFDIKGAGLTRSRVVLKGPRTYVISVMGANPRYEDFDHMVTTFHIQ